MSSITRRTDLDLGTRLILEGKTRADVERALVHRRYTAAKATELYEQALRQSYYIVALRALHNGAPPEETQGVLESRGLDPATAMEIVKTIQPWNVPQILSYLVDLLAAGKLRSVIERHLSGQVLPEPVAQAMLAEAYTIHRSAATRAGILEMLGGVVCGLIGLGINYASYWIAGHTGVWYVTMGFYVMGIVMLARGFSKLVT